MNPKEKLLAMMVEDHPLGYRNFEGITYPEGYGAGIVIVWNKCFYEPVERKKNKEEMKRRSCIIFTRSYFFCPKR